jgi:hypothetical protein
MRIPAWHTLNDGWVTSRKKARTAWGMLKTNSGYNGQDEAPYYTSSLPQSGQPDRSRHLGPFNKGDGLGVGDGGC